MKRTKSQKAITLVALIITIIVLLILAVVAIRTVTGDGIIAHAKNARTQYEQKAAEENHLLSNLSGYITGQFTEGWIQNKTEVKNAKTNQILTVGQTVTNYTAGGKTWKVLGAEDGKLLLMSTTNVKSVSLQGDTGGWNTAEYRFVEAEKVLNDECKTAIPDIGVATNIRSAKVEDINRVTGYNPESTGDENPYGKNEIYQYGNEVIYNLKDGVVAYSSEIKSADNSSYTKFEMPDKTALTTSAPIIVKSNYYYYYPNTLTTSSSGDTKGITTDSEAYKLLFRNQENSSDSRYCLASSWVETGEGRVRFGLDEISAGSVNHGTIITWQGEPIGRLNGRLWSSEQGWSGRGIGVRPVVSLDADFQPIV